jgi:hypothetical protein
MNPNRTRCQLRFQSMIGLALLAALTPSLSGEAKIQFPVAGAPTVVGSQLVMWTDVQRPQPVPPALSRPAHESPSSSNANFKASEERSNPLSEKRIETQINERPKQSVSNESVSGSSSVTRSSPQD